LLAGVVDVSEALTIGVPDLLGQASTDQVRKASRSFSRAFVPSFDGLALIVSIVLSGMHPLVIASGTLTFVLLNADGARAYRLDPRVSQDMGWLLGRTAVPLLAVVSTAALGLIPGYGLNGSVDRLLIAGSAGAFFVPAGRAIAYALKRAIAGRGLISERTLIVGAGELGIEIARNMDRYPEYGLHPIGFVDFSTTRELPYPLLGAPTDLRDILEPLNVRRVVIAFGLGNDQEMVTVVRQLDALPIEVHVVPRFFELGLIAHDTVDDLRGIPLVHLRRPTIRKSSSVSKRTLDLVTASLLLVLTSPLMVLAAMTIRFSSHGPVLFRQTRVGRRGREFEILKFRTMYLNEDSDTSWSSMRDQMTVIGRILRRTSVDELPQLINVIRGDMSLVGPRPERPYFVTQFSANAPRYADRLRVSGGMTGLAQVHGRSRGIDSIPERARLDNAYIETWSLWADIVILIRTLAMVFKGDEPG